MTPMTGAPMPQPVPNKAFNQILTVDTQKADEFLGAINLI